MAETSVNTISLKALVDKASNQIIFIESDNDFIDDVLFSFLTIPMGTIMRLAPNQSVPLEIGCIKNLYSSVKNMDVKHFRTEACRDMLLCPRNVAESHCRNLKLKIDNGSMTEEKNLLVSLDGGILLKGLARLIIGDNLQVMPPLTLEGLSVFTELGVRNGNTAEELTFNVGSDEVLNLLMCSLVSRTPLTETLLKNKPIRKLSNDNQGINIEPQIVVDATEPEGNLSIKLIVSKSKKMSQACSGFCYENHLLGTEEATYYYALGMLSTDKTLIASRISAAKKTRRSYYGEESAQTSIKSVTIMDPKSHNDQDKSAEGQGFLGGPAMFTVTDNLIIRPISLMFGLSLLNELKVPLTDIEVKIVHVRREEALRLLVASFVCDSALTNAFIREPKQNKKPKQEQC
ncbi:uncharacterized protein Pyn_35525 [Prunus yedoensis var. nudiflora]|uniref:DUF674 domain-containing protein n=1 Tax=Prunus yedoensis var. nudiflora TaxID=2094558 RepID=A0A314U6G0_PRUYE|nr:uncharacterized protein Pyn_35525 [Prunus yedoensis var. nudiflora]